MSFDNRLTVSKNMADLQEQNTGAREVGSSAGDSLDITEPFELDRCLAQTDLGKLAAISGSVPSGQPPFYNCFMNQFVNSPNFQKRLG
jgi:hypothetical protein